MGVAATEEGRVSGQSGRREGEGAAAHLQAEVVDETVLRPHFGSERNLFISRANIAEHDAEMVSRERPFRIQMLVSVHYSRATRQSFTEPQRFLDVAKVADLNELDRSERADRRACNKRTTIRPSVLSLDIRSADTR